MLLTASSLRWLPLQDPFSRAIDCTGMSQLISPEATIMDITVFMRQCCSCFTLTPARGWCT